MTNRVACAMILANLVVWGSPARGQATKAAAPATRAAVGPFDVEIVQRAAALLSSPQRWNRVDNGKCPRTDTTYSVRCALRRAAPWSRARGWCGIPIPLRRAHGYRRRGSIAR